MLRQFFAQWLAFSLFLTSIHPLKAQSAAGPAFTLPKTAVVLDLSVQKLTNTPGAFCDFADLFVPGLDLDVSCNGSLIPPLASVLNEDGDPVDFKADFEVPTGIDGKTQPTALLNLIKTKSKTAADIYDTADTTYKAAKKDMELLEKLEKSLEAAVANEAIKTGSKKAAEEALKETEEKINKVTKGNPLYNKQLAKLFGDPEGLKNLIHSKEAAVAELKKATTEQVIAQEEKQKAKSALESSKLKKEVVEKQFEDASKDRTQAKVLKDKMAGRDPFVTYLTRIQSYSISTIGLPDPEFLDAIPSRSGFLVDATQKLTIGENGVIQGIDLSKVDRTAEVILSVVKAAAGIFGRVVGSGSLRKNLPSESASVERLPGGAQSNKDKVTALLTLFENEFIESSGMKDEFKAKLLQNFRVLPLFRQVDYALAYYSSDAVKSSMISARGSFAELRSLWFDYNAVITTASGAGTPAVLAAQEKRIADLTQADWVGETSSLSWTPKYQLVPAKNELSAHTPENVHDSKPIALFSFGSCGLSKSEPFLASASSNAPRAIFCRDKDLKDDDVADSIKELAVSFQLKGDTLAAKAKNSPDKFPRWSAGTKGIPFIIPAEVSVNLSNTGLKLSAPSALIAQWGHPTRLPEDLAARDGGLTITYYSATGAIQNITMISKSKLESKTIDSLASSVDVALKAKLDADKAANTAANAASDKLALLEREKKILEAQVAIKKACEQLSSGCPVI